LTGKIGPFYEPAFLDQRKMDSQILFAMGLATLAATTLMTIFSYVVSKLRNRQFTEPILLNRFLCGFGILKEYQLKKNIAGWIIHYIVGLLFLLSYYWIWAKTPLDPTIRTALILGPLSGIVGIVGWSILFRIQSVPANIRVSEYYAQLFVAHVIFAITATTTFTLIS
jgi:hypothetical protein